MLKNVKKIRKSIVKIWPVFEGFGQFDNTKIIKKRIPEQNAPGNPNLNLT